MATTTAKQPGHSAAATITAELIGITVLTVLAGTDDQLGDVLVVLMWGIVIAWFLLHYSTFASWVGKL